jgi:hypothetical protein
VPTILSSAGERAIHNKEADGHGNGQPVHVNDYMAVDADPLTAMIGMEFMIGAWCRSRNGNYGPSGSPAVSRDAGCNDKLFGNIFR